MRRLLIFPLLAVLLWAASSHACLLAATPAAPATAPAKEAVKKPRTNRELQALKNPPPQPPAPLIIDGVMRAAVGYPRVFVRLHVNGHLVVGQPSVDMLQRARTLRGDWMDLNLASSRGSQSWWTAVLDSGANSYSVNQETSGRFSLRPGGDGTIRSSGIDGESLKLKTAYYGLSIAGSEGKVSEFPSMPFIHVENLARFTMETTYYHPQRQLRPDGMNLIGMQAIRQFGFEIDSSNAGLEQLARPLNYENEEAFEASLHGMVAGPRVTLRPAAFRPTNDVIRLPLRYVDIQRMNTSSAFDQPRPQDISPLLMGVRTSEGERQYVGNFLFDTGAPTTIISRWHAYNLGLIPHANKVYDQPEYEELLHGTSNREVKGSGFMLDTLEVINPAGQVIKWRNVPVTVHDVVQRQYNGGYYIYEGIIGSNLLLPTTDGTFNDQGLRVAPAAFEKWWLHGPTAELWLQRPSTNAPAAK